MCKFNSKAFGSIEIHLVNWQLYIIIMTQVPPSILVSRFNPYYYVKNVINNRNNNNKSLINGEFGRSPLGSICWNLSHVK